MVARMTVESREWSFCCKKMLGSNTGASANVSQQVSEQMSASRLKCESRRLVFPLPSTFVLREGGIYDFLDIAYLPQISSYFSTDVFISYCKATYILAVVHSFWKANDAHVSDISDDAFIYFLIVHLSG